MIFTFAIRYLFSHKSHSAINLITIVAAIGIAIITAAMVVVLSIYNGFEQFFGELSSTIDPDYRLEASIGKRFRDTPQLRDSILSIDGIESLNVVLEEMVLVNYNGKQVPAQIKGIDTLHIQNQSDQSCIIGGGLAGAIGINKGFVRPMTIYSLPDGKIDLYCDEVFYSNQSEYDDKLIIAPLETVRELLSDTVQMATAYEVYTTNNAPLSQEQISHLPSTLLSLDRQQQHADTYRIMQIEKWVTWLLITFILFIATFNAISALSMLIIDKQDNIKTLRTLGASVVLTRKIFTSIGCLINGIGTFGGIILGVTIVLIQQHFGIITLGGGDTAHFAIDAYPIKLICSDVLYTILTVTITGIITTIITVRSKVH